MVLAGLSAWAAWMWVWSMKVTLSPLQGDALCFVPAAMSLAEGNGLRNPVYHPGRVADRADPTRLNWHGPVAPHVWSWLAWDKNYIGLKFGGARTAALGLLAMLAALLRRGWRSGQTGWLSVWMPAWIILGSGWIFTHLGRPENVAAAAAVLTLAVLPATMSATWACIAGAGLGVVVATAPAAGMLLTPLVMLAVGLNASAEVLWKRLVILAVTSLAVCGTLLQTLGFGVGEWMEGMWLHGGEVILEGEMSSLKPYWLWLPDSPLLIVSLLAVLGTLWWNRPRREMTLSGFQKLVIIASILMLGVAAFIALIRIATNYYNVLPALACLIVFTAWQWMRRPLRLSSWALLLALGLPVLGLARSVVVLNSASAHGLSVHQAKQWIAEDFAKLIPQNQSVVFGHALFELTDTDALAGRPIRLSHDMEFREDCIVLPQAGMGTVEPPRMPGYLMVADRYVREVPQIGGITVARSTGAYGYAIYVRGK